MTNRSPTEIEREIEAERTALQRSLDELQAQFSPDHLVDQASDFLRTHGGEMAQTLGRTVKQNPVAMALTGIGLAWLMASSARNGRSDANAGVSSVPFDHDHRLDYDPRAVARHDPGARPAYDTTTRPRGSEPAHSDALNADFDARVRAADASMHRTRSPESPYALKADTSNGDQTMTDRIQNTWSSVKDYAQDVSHRVYSSAADLRDTIAEGTEDLPAAARARVQRARAAAIAAQEQLERRAAEVGRYARRTSHDNPLLVGAIAFGVGALFGASLPRTSVENRALGAHRDRLFDEADRILREEVSKAKRVAETVVAEGQAVVKDAVSGTASGDSSKSAVGRVTEAGKTEAKRQGLGDVN